MAGVIPTCLKNKAACCDSNLSLQGNFMVLVLFRVITCVIVLTIGGITKNNAAGRAVVRDYFQKLEAWRLVVCKLSCKTVSAKLNPLQEA